MALSVVLPFLPSGGAEAAPFARPEHKGYFYNDVDYSGGFVIRAGVHTTTTASFIAYIKSTLNSSNEQDQTGAEFIVLTMLGYPAGTTKATAHTAATLTDWTDAVNYYSSQGWINFHANVSYTQNTYWQGKNGGGTNPDDDAWFSDSGSTGADGAIFFHKPGTPGYAIRKACANPIGAMAKLALAPPPDFDVTLLADTNGSSSTVVAGQSYRVGVEVKNNGPANSSAGSLQVMMPAAGVVQACTPNCNDAGQNALLYGPTGPGGHGYKAASVIPGVAGKNWYWSVNPLGNGGAAGSVLNWTVAAGVTVGQQIKFEVYYYKADLGGAVAHKTVTFTVVSERTPGLSGSNGDIHAGGGTCGALPPLGAGNHVLTSPNGASYGAYVVSATGSVNGLFSNNAIISANDKLKIPNYAQVCRTDLLTAAATGWPSGPGIHNIGGGGAASFVLSGTEEGVYYFNGTHLNVHGAVGNPVAPGPPPVAPAPVTIVTLNPVAVVEIDGNILLNTTTAYDPHKVPSLGIISSSDILIDPAATQVDAYLFSSHGTIVTCNAAPAGCANNLRVNGFLMAKNLLFGRIGPNPPVGASAVSAPIVEQIVLNPQIYLNPPKYFDASVDDILLEGQGERAPLF